MISARISRPRSNSSVSIESNTSSRPLSKRSDPIESEDSSEPMEIDDNGAAVVIRSNAKIARIPIKAFSKSDSLRPLDSSHRNFINEPSADFVNCVKSDTDVNHKLLAITHFMRDYSAEWEDTSNRSNMPMKTGPETIILYRQKPAVAQTIPSKHSIYSQNCWPAAGESRMSIGSDCSGLRNVESNMSICSFQTSQGLVTKMSLCSQKDYVETTMSKMSICSQSSLSRMSVCSRNFPHSPIVSKMSVSQLDDDSLALESKMPVCNVYNHDELPVNGISKLSTQSQPNPRMSLMSIDTYQNQKPEITLRKSLYDENCFYPQFSPNDSVVSKQTGSCLAVRSNNFSRTKDDFGNLISIIKPLEWRNENFFASVSETKKEIADKLALATSNNLFFKNSETGQESQSLNSRSMVNRQQFPRRPVDNSLSSKSYVSRKSTRSLRSTGVESILKIEYELQPLNIMLTRLVAQFRAMNVRGKLNFIESTSFIDPKKKLDESDLVKFKLSNHFMNHSKSKVEDFNNILDRETLENKLAEYMKKQRLKHLRNGQKFEKKGLLQCRSKRAQTLLLEGTVDTLAHLQENHEKKFNYIPESSKFYHYNEVSAKNVLYGDNASINTKDMEIFNIAREINELRMDITNRNYEKCTSILQKNKFLDKELLQNFSAEDPTRESLQNNTKLEIISETEGFNDLILEVCSAQDIAVENLLLKNNLEGPSLQVSEVNLVNESIYSAGIRYCPENFV